MTAFVCENVLRDLDLVLWCNIYRMRYHNAVSYVRGVYNDNICVKSGPYSPLQWGNFCSICKVPTKRYTIFGPSSKGNHKTYCICGQCAQNSEEYLIYRCLLLEHSADKKLNELKRTEKHSNIQQWY